MSYIFNPGSVRTDQVFILGTKSTFSFAYKFKLFHVAIFIVYEF